MAPMQQLLAAAKLAREASQGRRMIEIVVTEIGVVVRGRTLLGTGAVAPATDRWASLDVPWDEVGINPDLLPNAVVLVDRKLSAAEGAS